MIRICPKCKGVVKFTSNLTSITKYENKGLKCPHCQTLINLFPVGGFKELLTFGMIMFYSFAFGFVLSMKFIQLEMINAICGVAVAFISFQHIFTKAYIYKKVTLSNNIFVGFAVGITISLSTLLLIVVIGFIKTL